MDTDDGNTGGHPDSCMKTIILIVFFFLCCIIATGLTGCGSNDVQDTQIPVKTDTTVTDEIRTIKIGNITDITGPGAVGMEMVNLALDDAVRYYNENQLIDGVNFKVISWDSQMDSSRTIPGYEFLMHSEVDLITTSQPGVAITLKPRVEDDGMVLFTMAGELNAIEPPGHIFSLGTIPQHEAYTLLSWIAQNDWDYKTNGPAKIGGAAWEEPYSSKFILAMEEYCKAHPDQFDFAGGFLTDFSFSWSSQVEALKECDYIFPNIMMNTLVEELRRVGSDAKLIGGSPHTALQKQLNSRQAWSNVDGMLIIYTGSWWNESGEEIDLFKQLLAQYHPNSTEEIITLGSGYQSLGSHFKMLEIVADAVEEAGVEDFDTGALYEAAKSYSKSIDGRDMYNFTDTKRYIVNYFGVLEVDAAKETLIRDDPNRYPVKTQP
jgi:hypothetical protein